MWVEADNRDSVRWYAHEVLQFRKGQPSWQEMERQRGCYDAGPWRR